MDKYKDLHDIKCDLVDAIKAKISEGIAEVDAEEMGAAIDMVKDLAQAEKDCAEACYYLMMIEDMGMGDGGAMGYDRWRYRSSGRFAPTGRGTRERGGYTPTMPEYTAGASYSPVEGRDGGTGMPGRNTRPDARMGHHKADATPKERMDDLREMMGDIWSDADTEQKHEMRMLVKDLLDQMERSM